MPWLLVRVRKQRSLATIAALGGVLVIATYVLVVPGGELLESAFAAGGLGLVNLALWFAGSTLERRLVGLARHRLTIVVLTVALAVLLPLAILEQTCRLLTDLHVLRHYQPIEAVPSANLDDWRLATMIGDDRFEPDPVLLWRPGPRRPHNSQRFKGPLAELPKPAGLVRIMCYGDSLTDGPPRGGWPNKLNDLLLRQPPIAGRRFEVLNAGTVGYSSHQGLLRFLQEVDRFDPDLLIVSFGWNDAANAIGQPDKSFRIPAWPLVWCQRASLGIDLI